LAKQLGRAAADKRNHRIGVKQSVDHENSWSRLGRFCCAG
jgi:hypothetical protein